MTIGASESATHGTIRIGVAIEHAAERARPSWKVDGASAFATAAFATLVVFHRLDVSAWFDEAYSYGVATQSTASFLTHTAWGTEANMLLYYLVLRSWMQLVSLVGAAPVEVLLRLPSAIFAVGSSVVVLLIGRRLFGRVAGLVAAGLYTTNFLSMILAQNARGYSLELLLLGLSWYSLIAGLGGNRRRWWVAYALTSALAVYAGLFSGLVIIAQLAALAVLVAWHGPWQARIRSSIITLAASLAAAAILILPLAVDVLVHGGGSAPPVRLGDVRGFFYFLAGDSVLYESALLVGIVLGVVTAWRSKQADLGAAVALVAWSAVPLMLAFALTQPALNLHLFLVRYLVAVVPPMCLLAGVAITMLPWRLAQVAAVIVLGAIAWPPLNHYYEVAQVQDFQKPVAWMQHRYQPGDGVVCAPVGACGIPLGYYFSAYPGPAHLDADSPGRWDWETYKWNPVTVDSVDLYRAGHRRIFYVYAPLGSGDVAAGESAQLQLALTLRGYKAIERITAHANSADTTVILYEVA